MQTSIQTIRALCKLSNKQEIKLSLNELTRGIFWAKCVKAGGFKWVGRHSARSPLAQGLRQYTYTRAGSTAEHNREQLIPLGQGSPAGITPKRPPPPPTVVQRTDRHFGKVHRTRGHDRAFACWEIFPRIWSTPRRCGPITGGKEEGVKVSWST